MAAIMCTDPVVNTVRRELRLFPDLKVSYEHPNELIECEVLKRETIEGDKAKEAASRINKTVKNMERAKRKEAVG